MSVLEYITRLAKFLQIESEILILTMMNIDKFFLKNRNFILNKINCYKVFLTSLLEINKLYDDFMILDEYFCKVGLINLNELSNLEKEFLISIDYCLFINEEDYLKYKNKLDTLYKLRISILNEGKNKLKADVNNYNKIIYSNN